MMVVGAADVHEMLDYPYLIDSLYEAHRGPHPASDHMVQSEPGGGENRFVTLVGWKLGGSIVVKMVGVFPGNRSLDPPRASVLGLVALFDRDTGEPRLVADGQAMTFRKTAADSGLGSSSAGAGGRGDASGCRSGRPCAACNAGPLRGPPVDFQNRRSGTGHGATGG